MCSHETWTVKGDRRQSVLPADGVQSITWNGGATAHVMHQKCTVIARNASKSEHYCNGRIDNDTIEREVEEETDNSTGPMKPLTITAMARTNLELRTGKIERQ